MRRLFLIALISSGLSSACSSTEEKADMAADDMTHAVETGEEAANNAMADANGQAAAASDGASKMSCNNLKDSRVLEIKKTSTGGCELFYTKFGAEKSVASSGISMKYCQDVREKIKSNLARSGFTCQ